MEDPITGDGTIDDALGIDEDALTQDLFGNFDDALAFTAATNFSVARDALNSDWRDAETGTLAQLTEAQYAAGDAIRLEAALEESSFGTPPPIKFRVLWLHGPTEVARTVFTPEDANRITYKDVLFNLPPPTSNRTFTWRLQIRSVSQNSGVFRLRAVVVHAGDGAASPAIGQRCGVIPPTSGRKSRLP